MPSRNVANPNQGRREWVGGRFSSPLHVAEGEPYRPQITLWLELPEAVVVGCQIEDPNAHKMFAETRAQGEAFKLQECRPRVDLVTGAGRAGLAPFNR